MGKLGKVTTKATYGILNLAMKPIYDQMKKERKEEVKRWNKSLDIASQDAMAEARYFEVRQPFDSIIHKHPLW
ncbi:hypothetical protein SBF1_50104 [Candidatus Desulfosporosinus infrequens]|uniref:Uncharacterized protein n=1 Tax=Candidatus Desulfosporosinus infrequens TaxID=2043169 RepID=A0A2U3LHA7_9FIRM|nr:hypothetical protein SBF1_50104 [Candidatus Desulfosporosinus infrequens]